MPPLARCTARAACALYSGMSDYDEVVRYRAMSTTFKLYSPAHLPQLQGLVNGHLGAVVSGWVLSGRFSSMIAWKGIPSRSSSTPGSKNVLPSAFCKRAGSWPQLTYCVMETMMRLQRDTKEASTSPGFSCFLRQSRPRIGCSRRR